MCCPSSSKKNSSASGPSSPDSPKNCKKDCPETCKLVSLTVVQNATQTNVTGAKNWAAIKKSSDDVIVQATTTPDTEACWQKINWSGDSGEAVPGKPNQRKLSRSASKKYHVQAELGGVSDYVDVWILWATVTINTSGTTPANAVQFGTKYDGTENLGARSFNGDTEARGKVIPEAKLTPAGVHDVVKSGWEFKRERMSHDWNDGAKSSEGEGSTDYWNTTWIDDTSYASYQKVVPDNDDKIYDRDAPNITGFGATDSETYNNFRQWIKWGGDDCSDKAEWYWKGQWKKSAAPQVQLKDVGTGNITLPDKSHYHP
jgi:hypothetical protein